MKIKCSHCGNARTIEPQEIGQQLHCDGCGREFTAENPNLMPCPDCFSPVSRRASVCPRCGAPLTDGRPAVGKSTDAEEPVAVYHPGAMNYLGSITLGIISIPLLVGIGVLLYVYIQIKYTRYELTTRRIICRRGWIAKSQSEIWLKDMRGVQLEQSVWQRIIRVGDIFIGTAASAGTEICMTGIANPADVVTRINALRRS